MKPVTLIGATGLAFGLFDGLRHGLFVVEDEGLIQEADLFVIGLDPGLDDLLDHSGGFALRFELIAEHVLLALDNGRIETSRIDRERISGGNMHRHHAAERFELIRFAGGFETDNDADTAEAVGHTNCAHKCRSRRC